jgi:OPA family glycerol-3-phosphate transporter-like MFS transporter
VVNGPLTDRLGGQKALLIGAAGTVICNLAFGAASFMGMLWLFIVLRGIDGYAQSFGAPGFIKINASWFSATERGTFAGVLGFMINLGRVAINQLGPAGIAAIVAVALAIWVKDTPEEAGFHEVFKGEADHDDTVKADLWDVFVTIVSNKFVWIIAGAYACTGAVRQTVDQWFPRYMQEVHKINLDEPLFLVVVFLIPVVASAGSFISGVVSDHLFGGRRAPVAAWIYCIEIVTILIASRVSGATAIAVAFVMVAFTANSTHSLLGPAAAMDIGGRKAAAFASGCIHSF